MMLPLRRFQMPLVWSGERRAAQVNCRWNTLLLCDV